MGKRFSFNIPKAIQFAWDLKWTSNLKQREDDAKYFKKTGRHAYNEGRTYYLTASDIERTVRDLAAMSAKGEEWSTDPEAIGYGGWGSGIRFRGNLQRAVRDWLLRNPKLTSHNFGKGHISGQRFRPVGQPIAPSEEKTFTKIKKQRAEGYARPNHFRVNSRPLCQVERMKGRMSWRGSKAWMTNDKEKVTCARCKKLLLTYKPKEKRKHDDTHASHGE